MRERRILFVLDGLAILTGFVLGYAFRFTTGFFPDSIAAPLIPYLKITGFAVAAWLMIFYVLGLYRQKLFFNPCEELCLLIQGSFWAMVFLIAGTGLYRGFSYSRLALGFGGIFVFLLLGLVHEGYKRFLHRGPRRILVIGRDAEVEILLKRLRRHVFLRLEVETMAAYERAEVLARVAGRKPDCIIASLEKSEDIRALQETGQQAGIPFYLLPEFHQFFLSGRVENVDGLPLFISGQLPVERYSAVILKRLLDLAVGIPLGLLFCALLPLTALIIRLESPGPVFFRQKRLGKNGRVFAIFKFRTMRTGAGDTSPFTLPDDPRITRFGRFLRRYNLDELPQIFNVLAGSMSLVGPRPIALNDTFFFSLPDFALRMRARPGMTGWSQIHGLRGGHIEPQERIRYDLYYLENWSIWLDLAVILCSPFAFKNAY